MAPSKKGKKTGTSEPVKKVTQDSRFSHVQEDPRFMRPKKGQSKVKVDKRFAHMIKDKDFTETSKVDRYGRVRDDNRIEAQLRNTYDFSGSEDEESESSNDEDDGDEERPAGYVDRARGEGIDSESSSESDSDISDIEWGKVGGRREGGLSDVEEDPDTIPRGDETRRFACVNLDWDHVRAVDLLTVFSAFKPDGGSVLSVRIYPSEFGKERVAKEAIEGPPRDIFGDSKQNDKDDSGSESDEDLVKRQVEDGNEELDQVALRKYELEKMKYYFAVAEFDSVETARAVYNHCDDTEFEASANFLDLRFIPDEMEFDDTPTDEALRVPEKYEPADFTTQALQHSKVSLTWDADEPSRTKVTRRAFTQDEVENMDFAGLLASSDESSDEEARTRARNLLLAGNNDSDSDESHADDGENEMEITFTPGLSEAAAEKLESKNKQQDTHENETAIERFRRVKKERREKWKGGLKNKKNDLVSDDELDAETAADPFFTYSDDEDKAPAKTKKVRESKSERKQRQEKEQKERDELELLLDGAESGRKHFDMAEIVKAEKHKGKKKGKKGQKRVEVEDGFKVDASDPRFSALYDSHNFAIDPNNPNFKKTKAMKELLNESRKRHKSSYN